MRDQVKTIFFDLDHTIWDFEKNSSEALQDLIRIHGLESVIGNTLQFIADYKKINHLYWEAYRKGEMEKAELRIGRFREALSAYGVEDPAMHEKFADGYVELSPEKTNLFPHAHEVLEYLAAKYPMYIITNGFEEIQGRKMRNTKINTFFKGVITSEMAGVRKPHPDIFKYAMGISNAMPHHSVMIGDEPDIDIRGAGEMGLFTILFNPVQKEHQVKANHEIHSLIQLKELL
ncbi:MAG: YjjG family noncanonical pyrimidine nucleotidase [Flavobacteriales bacterium]|nr:YjjG family noncanonical pyrimidine nucleotidase [Flavobacteriales bacterium]